MKELILLLGLCLLTFSQNAMGAGFEKNFCDDLYKNLVEDYKRSGKDVIQVHNDEQLLRCFDKFGKSEHYQNMVRIQEETRAEDQARKESLITKEFTKTDIAELLFFATTPEKVEKSKLLSRRQSYKLRNGVRHAGKTKALTDVNKLCEILMGSKLVAAIYVDETKDEIDELDAIGYEFIKGDYPKRFEAPDDEDYRGVFYIEKIKCAMVKDAKFKDVLEMFEDSFSYRKARSEEEKAKTKKEHHDGKRKLKEVDYSSGERASGDDIKDYSSANR